MGPCRCGKRQSQGLESLIRSSALTQPVETPTVTLLRAPGSSRRGRRRRVAALATQFEVGLGRWRRDVLVELARHRLGNVTVGQPPHQERPLAPWSERDLDAVAQRKGSMRLGSHPVDLDLATVAQGLGLRTRWRNTGNVEPDIEADTFAHTRIIEAAATYNAGMSVAAPGLVALVVAATLAGGLLPLRFDRHTRIFLGFSAGTLVALALLELIPEGLSGLEGDPHRWLLLCLGSFLATLLLEKLHVLHPHEHGMDEDCPPHSHTHRGLGMHGAWGLVVHSALDGVALATALRGSLAAGVAVGLALAAHKFADGLTTVTLVLSHHHGRRQAVVLLAFNAFALTLGFAAGSVVPLGQAGLSMLLLVMAGFFLYLGASDLLPSLGQPRCRTRDVLATAVGMAVIAAVSLFSH